MPDIDHMGAVDYLVVEFPGGKLPGLPLLVDLVDRGIIRILDLALVRKDVDGSVTQVSVADLVAEGNGELTVFEGAASGLLLPEDIEAAGRILEPGTTGLVVVYENAWSAPLAVAFRKGGAQLIAEARIPVQGLLAALDAAEADRTATAVG
jgi:hypothetical protein